MLGEIHPNTNRGCYHLARIELADSRHAEALRLAESALANHGEELGPTHSWTLDSASATADALDGLFRHDEAAAVRAKYGLADNPPPA